MTLNDKDLLSVRLAKMSRKVDNWAEGETEAASTRGKCIQRYPSAMQRLESVAAVSRESAQRQQAVACIHGL